MCTHLEEFIRHFTCFGYSDFFSRKLLAKLDFRQSGIRSIDNQAMWLAHFYQNRCAYQDDLSTSIK